MKLLKILGHTVSVKRVKRTLQHERLGESDHSTGEIRIVEGLEKSVEMATLLHEVIHVIDGHLDLGLSEDQVCGVAQGLFAFLAENEGALKR